MGSDSTLAGQTDLRVRKSEILVSSPLHMIGTQVCSVENTHIMGRNATTLPYVMGKKVEVHPSKGRGQSNEMLGSG